MTADLPLDPPTTFGDDRSTEQLAAAVGVAMWRQSTGDALVSRLHALAEDLAIQRAALVVVTPIDREVLAPAGHHLSDALRSVQSAAHLLDTWQQGDQP